MMPWVFVIRRRLFLCLLLLSLLSNLPICNAADDGTNTFQAEDACKRDSDCQNGGSCSLADKFTVFNRCICTKGHGGTNCEETCPLSCEHDGACRATIDQEDPDNTSYECVCRGQWTGDKCHIPFRVCKDHTMCMHGGSCKLLNNRTHVYGCDCPLGFDGGPTCAINPNKLTELEGEIEEAIEPKVIAAMIIGIFVGLGSSILIIRVCRRRRGYRLDVRSMKNSTDGAFEFNSRELQDSSFHSLNLEMI